MTTVIDRNVIPLNAEAAAHLDERRAAMRRHRLKWRALPAGAAALTLAAGSTLAVAYANGAFEQPSYPAVCGFADVVPGYGADSVVDRAGMDAARKSGLHVTNEGDAAADIMRVHATRHPDVPSLFAGERFELDFAGGEYVDDSARLAADQTGWGCAV